MPALDRSIIDVAYLKAWAPRTQGLDELDPDLGLAIQSASEMLEQMTGRVFLKASFSEFHEGRAAQGTARELLKTSAFPLTYPTDPVTITEDGVSLVVAEGYTTSADAVIDCVRGNITRRAGGTSGLVTGDSPVERGWSQGRQNIAITYKAGWAADDIPHRIRFACAELAWRLHREIGRSGKDTSSRTSSSSVRYLEDLSSFSRDTIRALSGEAAGRISTATVVRMTAA